MKFNNMSKNSVDNVFAGKMFFICLGYSFLLLLLSGVHYGLTVLVSEKHFSLLFSIVIPVLFWIFVSYAVTLYTRRRVIKVYSDPMHMLSDATSRVAKGDFSVSVEPVHSAENSDYIDRMFHDFNTMVRELNSIETLKTDFLSNVSHELKTPIAIIQNTIELMQKSDCSEEITAEYLETMSSAAKSLSALVTGILKLNKIENQVIVPDIRKVNISDNLAQSVLKFEKIWEEKNIDINVEISDDVITAETDAEMMETVWNNLISNALKFTQEGGNVEIREYSDSKNIYIEIADNGCGISEEAQKHIYDKFYREGKSQNIEGNGLGLAITYEILKFLNCKILLESEENKGTCFKVIVPAVN